MEWNFGIRDENDDERTHIHTQTYEKEKPE